MVRAGRRQDDPGASDSTKEVLRERNNGVWQRVPGARLEELPKLEEFEQLSNLVLDYSQRIK